MNTEAVDMFFYVIEDSIQICQDMVTKFKVLP